MVITFFTLLRSEKRILGKSSPEIPIPCYSKDRSTVASPIEITAFPLKYT